MGVDRLKRIYERKPLDLASVRAIRAAFVDEWFGDGDLSEYRLRYRDEDVGVSAIGDVERVFAERGSTSWVRHTRKNSSGRFGVFDSTHADHMSIEFYSRELRPEVPMGRIEQSLGLHRLKRWIRSSFVAHGFDQKGRSYAREIRAFLEALGMEVESGEYYEPIRVSEKVQQQIDRCDSFIAIVTPQDDQTWVTQETLLAKNKGKSPIVVLETGTSYKPGILGDYEYAEFSENHFSESFTKILQGLRSLCREGT